MVAVLGTRMNKAMGLDSVVIGRCGGESNPPVPQ